MAVCTRCGRRFAAEGIIGVCTVCELRADLAAMTAAKERAEARLSDLADAVCMGLDTAEAAYRFRAWGENGFSRPWNLDDETDYHWHMWYLGVASVLDAITEEGANG